MGKCEEPGALIILVGNHLKTQIREFPGDFITSSGRLRFDDEGPRSPCDNDDVSRVAEFSSLL